MEIHRRATRPPSLNNASDNSSSDSNVASAQGGGGGSHVAISGPPTNTKTTGRRSIKALVLVAAAAVAVLLYLISDTASSISISSSLRRASTSFSLQQHYPTVNREDFVAARKQLSQLREEFYYRYGGEEMAMKMLQRGLRTFEQTNSGKQDNDEHGGSIRATANRFLSAIVRHEGDSASIPSSTQQQQQQPEFVMAFAGYSVTVGRGNHLEQSYPFVLEKILSPILELPPLNIKLTVRNSAIGGIPSFPYGWCLRNFLGEDADLVSWDYGMNEGNGASGLESYVRQSLALPKSPLFVLLDIKTRPRLDILQRYVNLGVLSDPIALGGKDAVDPLLLEVPENKRPVGLQKWEEWGAPKGAPGQSPWHAKKMEHELMAWMLAMRMLDALDMALNVMEQDVNWRIPILALLKEQQKRGSAEVVFLPPPVTDVSKTGVPSLLHGSESTTKEWHMGRISCRTSFLPTISGDLNSIVESGVTMDDADMLQRRDDVLFDGGWVMDVGKLERETKLKVLKYGGLGYIDMKMALYGIPTSGTLKFWLPYEGSSDPVENASASEYFNAIVVCEVNEKRGDKECNMVSDLEFRVGDAAVPRGNILQVKDVASYLKKDICIRVIIPTEAKISLKHGSFDVGLALEVRVSGNAVTRENGACSISHVIWENQDAH
ncbi:hypothetical protein ACHAXH_009511 [Discostella pseudostelligera]